jgi:cytochrome c-type protein NapB
VSVPRRSAVPCAPAAALVVGLAACAVTGATACAPRAGPLERAAYRRVQRAYEGAPPVVPHAVRSLQRQDCLACHGDGLRLADGGLAPRTPHPGQTQCPQCHVEQVAAGPGPAESTFAGLVLPARGTRAYAGAPPTIPHALPTRRECLGCHGEYGGSPIRTPHPDRVNCRQCHVEGDAGLPPWRDTDFEGLEP